MFGVFWSHFKEYMSNVLWAGDIFLNVLAFGERETISARLGKGKLRNNKVAIAVCRLLDRVDPSHCADSAKWWKNVHKQEGDN